MEMLDHSNQRPKRPVFLTVLCILTFVQTGLSLLMLLIGLMQGPISSARMLDDRDKIMHAAAEMRGANMDGLANLLERASNMAMYTNSMFYTMAFLNILSAGLGLAGALLMWKGRKIGFHAYIIYNLMAILTIYVAVPMKEVPSIFIIVNAILSAVFIFMYSRNLKWLK